MDWLSPRVASAAEAVAPKKRLRRVLLIDGCASFPQKASIMQPAELRLKTANGKRSLYAHSLNPEFLRHTSEYVFVETVFARWMRLIDSF